MQRSKRAILTAMLFSAVLASVCSAETTPAASNERHPNVSELLDKWAEALRQCRSFTAKVKVRRQGISEKANRMMGKDGVFRYVYFITEEVRFDGKRAAVLRTQWGQINPRFEVSKDRPLYGSDLWDGKALFQYSIAINVADSPGRLFIIHPGPDDRKLDRPGRTFTNSTTAWLLGYLPSVNERVDAIVRKAGAIVVRNKKEKIRGSQCYVIDADTKYGKYTIWLDPSHGYHVARAAIMREPGDLNTDITDRTLQPGQQRSFNLNRVSFKKIGNLWFPVEADAQSRFVWRDCSPSEDSYHIELSNVALNPDHDRLRSFFPGDIKDGAEVLVVGAEGSYTWKGGKVVDGHGREVDIDALIPKEPTSLVGKPLPELKGVGLALEPDQTRDRIILVCFWDMNQRPSRHCIRELAKRAEEFKEKGIAVVCVQASKVEKSQLDVWVKKYNIPFPVGMVKGDEEKVRFAWGAKSLPWLILTDQNHILREEGFALGELSKRIEALKSTNNKLHEEGKSHGLKSSQSRMYVSQLLAYGRSVNQLSSIDLISKRTIEHPLRGTTTSRVARLRFKGDKVRSDVTAEIIQSGADRQVKGIVKRSWTDAYNGEFTSKLPHSEPFFTISRGNAVAEYGQFFQGAYMLATRLDDWLAGMEIKYAGHGDDEFLHRFTGLRRISPDQLGRPRLRRFEMAASEKFDFAIVSCKIYDETERLLGTYDASGFRQVVKDVWLPTKAQRVSYHGPNGKVNRRTWTEIGFIAINEPIDDALFELSPPSHYGIIDRVRNVSTEPKSSFVPSLSLAEKPLPELKGLGFDLEAVYFRGKVIMVCFLDMQQSPSRHLVSELTRRAEGLEEKGVAIVAVQASKVDKNELDAWVKKHQIPFPVAMVQDDEEETRLNWGVKSLPWLILTDRSHIVRAEGFGLNELNERIGANEDSSSSEGATEQGSAQKNLKLSEKVVTFRTMRRLS